jgi:hypothetical protein
VGREKAHVALDVQAEHCANPHLTGGGLGVVDRGVGESLTATAGTAGIEMANVVELRLPSRAWGRRGRRGRGVEAAVSARHRVLTALEHAVGHLA